MALPARYVFAPHGRYLISGTVDMKGVVFAGEDAQNRRTREAGIKGATFGEEQSSKRELTPELLAQRIDELRGIVGEALDRLLISDHLGRNASTPPKHRNALAEVVAQVRDAANALTGASPIIDPRPILELDGLLHILARWNGHPLWPKIAAALVNEYAHSVVTLAAASLLEDVGNGVVLFESESGRGADLMLVTGPRQRAAVEVKAPKVLRGRRTAVGIEEASTIIEKAVKKAGTGATGQLSNRQSGLIVIGGFHLTGGDLDTLERAATAYLSSAMTRQRHEHLLGIAVVVVGATVEADFTSGGIAEHSLSGIVEVRVAKHPGYRGDMTLKTEPVKIP
jgi:hypothetical protein